MKKYFLYSLVIVISTVQVLAGNRFRVNVIGDVQVGDAREFEYASKSVFRDLIAGDPSSINLFLGDQVNENMEDMLLFRQHTDLLPQSENHFVLGNHDRDVDSLRQGQEKTFNRVFGPSYYAFRKGNFHFIVLNNVYGMGLRAYKGYIPEEQLDFVRTYLKKVGKRERLVFTMHIPLAYTENTEALLELLSGRGNVLALTGHLHEIMRKTFIGKGVEIHDVTAGATCGIWWRGELDWEGVPVAIMQGGAPRGYFIFDFDRKSYNFRFKGVGLDGNRQMSISIPGTDLNDSAVDSLSAKEKGSAYVSVFGAFEETEVRYRLDSGEWKMASKADAMDNNVARMRYLNDIKSYPTALSKREPLRRKTSGYVWRMEIPEEYFTGVHKIEIEASDRYGFHAKGARLFFLDKDYE